MMDGISVLLAEGSPVYRKMFTRAAVESAENVKIDYAADREETLGRIRGGVYDLVVVDAEIADAGIKELLSEIGRMLPRAYILITARPSRASDALFAEAIAESADECMIKPIYASYTDNLNAAKETVAAIFPRLRGRAGKKRRRFLPEDTGGRRPGTADADRAAKTAGAEGKIRPAGVPGISGAIGTAGTAGTDRIGRRPGRAFYPEVVLMAASTGGPTALEKILSALDEAFPAPILIVQHMPPHFMEAWAGALDRKSGLRIKLAEDGERISAGTAYIAPGDLHMRLDAEKRIVLDGAPPINGLRPAADALFSSVAEALPRTGVLAVVLTGMGRDGENGLASLKEKHNCFCMAQSEETCVVYGMPRVAAERGLADVIVDLQDIAEELWSFPYPSGRPAREG